VFNLARLMVGSEGTLGVVLSAKLNVVALPKAKAVMAIQFAHLLESLAATPLILRHGPSAVEVMDKSILDYTRKSAALEALRQSFIEGDPAALLCVEFYADRADDLPPRLDALERDLRTHGFGYRYHHALDLAAQARIWSLREAGLGLSMAMREDAKSLSFVEDTAVAPERLRDYIERFLDIVARHETTAGVYAHASVGCLHVRPVVNMKTEAGVRKFEAIANDISDLVLEFGGALSGEHGDGLVRSPFMEKMFGPTLYAAFRTIKQTFDPHGIFNPGKIVDAPPDVRSPKSDHLLRLRSRRRGGCDRDVQWTRRLPQDARRHDVPVVHGDPRGTALDAWPGQRAPSHDCRPAARVRAWRSRRLRIARSVPGVSCLQGRVPRRCRRRAIQERVPR
jgi:FAD/FMN-containing dehydrogenase